MSTRVVNIQHRDGNDLSAWGMIPAFISPVDETPLWEQVHNNYGHGGGWNDFKGFAVLQGGDDEPYKIQYPGDPHYMERSRIEIGDERLVLFNYGWVLWTDGETEKIARID